ncbi:hypothetical protein [Crocinitomix catalasitica]|uniref:hypothetical protein n=1 Tax=Crocinitomix catalasitica TaxID=184607 RepID=UPI0012F8C467|nr:hypothetical protein [Crocinitomix catalasitica]
MDTINTQVDFINLRLNNFGFIKETIKGQNYELAYLEGYFGIENKDRFGLFLPRNFERKIYGMEIEEISSE